MDLPRETVLQALPDAFVSGCLASFYIGYVRPRDDPSQAAATADDLWVELSTFAGACRDVEVADLRADLASNAGVVETNVSGVPVYTIGTEVFLAADDFFVRIGSRSVETVQAMQLFIDQFMASAAAAHSPAPPSPSTTGG
jgi:hypothetical protein